ncbi:MAG: Trk system potassium transporter TrkA [Fibrobacteria bacterium]|nr:Trk system potassium transporter TrkA [Fibrobacteria bacterium]
MKIVIAGAGTIGLNLATKLSYEGHDLFLIDNDRNKLRSAEEGLDVKTIVGEAASIEVLRQANAEDAHLLIAVTRSDAVNILVCQLAARLGTKKRIARIRHSGCFQDPSVIIPYDLDIDMVIYPEGEVAKEIWQLLHRPFAIEVSTFFNDQIEVIGLHITENSILEAKTLTELKELSRHPFTIVGIVRDSNGIVPVAWDGVLKAEDKIYLSAISTDINEIVEDFGFETKKISNVFIYGGDTVGFNLAKRLENTKVQARILEPCRNRIHELAYELKKVLVLHGEGTDSSLLEGEGIEEADVFVAVTDDEEANLLSCILAKKKGAVKTISLVTKPDYIPLIADLGVDAVISKRLTTLNRIMQFVIRGEVVSVSDISEGEISAIEFRITKNTIVSGMEIGSEEFNDIFPDTAIIGGLQLETGQVSVPEEGTVLNVGDRVIVYVPASAVREVEKIFV